jgi:hypothetical protein
MTKLEKQEERRKELFVTDLQAVLDKYGATLEICDIHHCNGTRDLRMEVEIQAIYDADNNCVEPYCDIALPSYMPPTKKG